MTSLIEAIMADKRRLERENAELWATVQQQAETILRLREALERAHHRNGYHDDKETPPKAK